MSFPRVDQLRTDHNFRFPQRGNDAETNHHKEYSILQELPIDMISSFPTSDPLHLLELGIMKTYIYKIVFTIIQQFGLKVNLIIRGNGQKKM